MKRILYAICGCFIFLLFACQKFDSIALWNMANSQEKRLIALEELCGQMNTNIDALRTLVTASQIGDYIMNVAPVTKDGQEVGYAITFAQSGTITIYHGKDGKDGKDGEDSKDGNASGSGDIPSIGLKEAEDGAYYWTLNGEWLLDESGNKVKASGNDGKNGQTPQLKIENGHWMLSMDDGTTWKDLGKATGEDGDSGDGIFEKVDYTTNDDCVVFTLVNGGEFRLPKSGNGGSLGALSITFSETTDILVEPLVDYDIAYTITGADANTTIEATGMDGFKATVKPTSNSTGTITVAPAWKNVDKSVVVMVTDGKGRTTIKKLTFRYDDEHSYIIFPDETLKAFLLAQDVAYDNEPVVWTSMDQDCNGEISYSEAKLLVYLSTLDKGIYSYEGIQYFSNLKTLIWGNTHQENYSGKFIYASSLNVCNMTNLERLSCYGITSLDINGNTTLNYLNVGESYITSLNLSGFINLEELRCSDNRKFISIDVSECTKLTDLTCSNGRMSLNLNGCSALRRLTCTKCHLTSLDISTCVSLRDIDCSSNDLSESDLNKIFTDLPQVPSGETRNIKTSFNLGSKTCNTSIAKKKGWNVTNNYSD